MNVFGIGLSGMNAAQVRLGNSANNVANLQSTSSLVNGERVERAYQPTDVSQRSIEPTGGVETSIRTRNPAIIPVYQPENSAADENGIVEFPNVNLEEEAVQQKIASYDFKANAKVIKTQDEMMKSLLDIKA
jgi:flagellar basal-body rod protein FlgC